MINLSHFLSVVKTFFQTTPVVVTPKNETILVNVAGKIYPLQVSK